MQDDSKQRRRCIGVIITKPDRDLQGNMLKGIYKAAFERDMNVAVFACTLSGGLATPREPELDIFTLPNFDLLDGIIYVPDFFDYKGTEEVINKPLIQAVKDKRICAVTLGTEVEGLPAVQFDDEETIRAIINHLTDDHGCRDIAFMTGHKHNPYSTARLQQFIDILAEKGLTVPEDRQYYGDFWYDEGENFARQLIESEKGLPEAILCANNHMACSVYKALLKFGYMVPKDVIIACYSDEEDMHKFISSASNRGGFEGYNACQALIEIMDGKREPITRPAIKSEFHLHKSATCGCLSTSQFDLSAGDGIDINEPWSYFSEFNFMTTELLSKNGYREMFWTLDWYTTYIKDIQSIWFCMCDGWDKPCNEELFPDEEENEEKLNYRGYTEQIQPYFYRINNSDGTHESHFDSSVYFPVKEMLPALFSAEGEPSSYIFRALHFADRNFGYVVIGNGNKLKTYDIMVDYWLRDIENVMEYQRKLNNEKYLYSSDFMTGLVNRNGFNRMVPGIIEEAKRGGYQLFFALCDMNGLKFINDTYGHIEGDNGIKIASGAMVDADFPEFDVEHNFRIGGDEFVKVVVGNFTEESVNRFKNRIYSRLEEYNKTSGKPYPVYLSVGAIVKDPDEEFTADSMITEADKLMFADKQRIKQETGFNPFRK